MKKEKKEKKYQYAKFSFSCPIEFKEKFKELAKKEGRTLSNYVQRVLKQHLESVEKGE